MNYIKSFYYWLIAQYNYKAYQIVKLCYPSLVRKQENAWKELAEIHTNLNLLISDRTRQAIALQKVYWHYRPQVTITSTNKAGVRTTVVTKATYKEREAILAMAATYQHNIVDITGKLTQITNLIFSAIGRNDHGPYAGSFFDRYDFVTEIKASIELYTVSKHHNDIVEFLIKHMAADVYVAEGVEIPEVHRPIDESSSFIRFTAKEDNVDIILTP